MTELKTLNDIMNNFPIEKMENGKIYRIDMADELRKEAIKCIKLKKEIDKLKSIKDKEYSLWCDKKDTYSNEYYRVMKEFQEPIDKLYKEFEDIGLKFYCTDYGDDYCLDLSGLIHVLTIFFNLTEEDLK